MKTELQVNGIEELHDEEYYCLCAPDGSAQLMTLSPDYQTCAGVIKLLEGAGLGQSPAKLFQRGFAIMPVKVTILRNGDEKSGYQKAVAPFKN